MSPCAVDLMCVYARIMRNVFQIGHEHARILWGVELAFLCGLLSLLPQEPFLCATILKPHLYSGFTDAQSLGYLFADERSQAD